MRLACLQFAPELGKVEGNIARANKILDETKDVSDIDILVLPELAFSGNPRGYNFLSLEAITPFLEPTSSGPSTQWAIKTARKLNCIVMVGYPELDTTDSAEASISASSAQPKIPPTTPNGSLHNTLTSPPLTTSTDPPADPATPKRYNSLVAVSPTGTILAHYRKSFLFYTDETWASESPTGFTTFPLISLPIVPPSVLTTPSQPQATPESSLAAHLTRVTPGICMDINPHRFTAPWSAFELATHARQTRAQSVILSMAWLVPATVSRTEWEAELSTRGEDPDMETLGYWVKRLGPLVGNAGVGQEAKGVLVCCANRTGIEGEACYAGSSVVMRLGRGEVEILGMLGKGEERVLMVDVEEGAKWRLMMAPVGSVGQKEEGDGEKEDEDEGEGEG
ncbi:MAG: Carbon-nitrogen hydrolase [Bathelium mastoideum]|nr:MAG: Carbon-nitrogen hydrolase [Bathelium mastoideum]